MAKNKVHTKNAPHNFKDLTGQRFNKLLVVKRVANKRRVCWDCKCDCGNHKVVSGSDLKRNNTQSCGCFRSETASRNFSTHKKRNSPEYINWLSMKSRCYYPKNNRYANYGGRGIIVSPEWINDFSRFFEDMGPRPSPKHQIDRIDVNGNYSKENCKWSTTKEQGLNKRNTEFVWYKGIKTTIPALVAQYGIRSCTLRFRLRHGWPLELALTAPLHTCFNFHPNRNRSGCQSDGLDHSSGRT